MSDSWYRDEIDGNDFPITARLREELGRIRTESSIPLTDGVEQQIGLLAGAIGSLEKQIADLGKRPT